ncbi:hypothetical protein SDC9_79481 [bioreactor metagenome]|uniref:Uncharacterized protein n=1 Tax=bioreactor metagenome TaxID=1076179 RepID=A0A644Z473_9ZZZZ
MLGEGPLDPGPVVVAADDGVGGGGRRDARGRRVTEGRGTGAGGDEQRVDVAVVAALELDHLVPAGGAAGQPQGGHRRLGAGVDQPDLLDRGAGDDLGGQVDLGAGRGAEGGAVRGRPGDRVEHLGMRVPQQHRPPGADQVDVLVAVDVGDVRPPGRPDEPRRATDGAEGAHRGAHPTRDHLRGALIESG